MPSWFPYVCPGRRSCEILVLGAVPGVFVSFEHRCDFHESTKGNFPNAEAQFDAIAQGMFAVERAKASAKAFLGLSKESEIPYRVNDDGSFTVGMDHNGNVIPEWAAADKGQLTAEIAKALADIRRPAGAGTVRLA